MMKMVVLDGYTENPGDLSWDSLREFGELTVYDRTGSEDEVIERIGDNQVVFVNKVPISKRVLEACPNIRFISVLATGYNVIDCRAAAEKGIPVSNVPTYGTAAVAQFAIALLLEVCHHVAHHSEAVHQGRWASNPDWCFWDSPLIELQGKTMGIIGFGRIGQATGRIARALGMKVIAYSRSVREDGKEVGDYVDLDTLLRESDIITLHAPATGDNTHMIDDQAIAKMKPGVILINTARGPLVDTDALIRGRESGKIGAAGLDVIEHEAGLYYLDRMNDILDNHDLALLRSFPNVVITPHTAFYTNQSVREMVENAVKGLYAFAAGQENPFESR